MKRSLIAGIVVSIAAVAVAAGCGGGGYSATAAMSPMSSMSRTTSVKAANSSLGRLMVDAKGVTVYLFEKDTSGRSSCSAACAQIWPPVLTRGKPSAGKGARASLLGVIQRAGGARQVTYGGHPLYRYAGDTRPGQTSGEGLRDYGASWYALTPAGKKIDQD